MIEIEIVRENVPSRFGINVGKERASPLQATIQPVTAENLATYVNDLDLPNDFRREDTIRNIVEGKSVYLVALDPETNKVAGYISVNTTTTGKNKIYIETAKEYRGRTIGKQLIKDLQARFDYLTLDNLAGKAGHDFYAKMGFVDERMPGSMSWRKPVDTPNEVTNDTGLFSSVTSEAQLLNTENRDK